MLVQPGEISNTQIFAVINFSLTRLVFVEWFIGQGVTGELSPYHSGGVQECITGHIRA